MTAEQFLAARSEGVPEVLAGRLLEVLDAAGGRASTEVPAALSDAAMHLLRSLLGRSVSDRSQALDLLTVDALITYACEGAAGRGTLGEVADRVLSELAVLAALSGDRRELS